MNAPVFNMFGFFDINGLPGNNLAAVLRDRRPQGIKGMFTYAARPGLGREATEAMIQIMHFQLLAHQSRIQLLTNSGWLIRRHSSDRFGVLLGLPGTSWMKKERWRDDIIFAFDHGVRVVQIGDEAAPSPGGSFVAHDGCELTDEGKQLVRWAGAFGMILDLSRLPPLAALQVIRESRGPVWISHTACTAMLPERRALNGTEPVVLKALAEQGGVVGIVPVRPRDIGETAVLRPFAEQVHHAVDIAGERNVCLGTGTLLEGDPHMWQPLFTDAGADTPPEIGAGLPLGPLAQIGEHASILSVNACRFLAAALPKP